MWRAREKEQELDTKLKNRAKDNDVFCGDKNHGDSCKKVPRHGEEAYRSSTFASTSKRDHNEHSCYSREDGGLKDDEVEEFLRSRLVPYHMYVNFTFFFWKECMKLRI